MRFSRSLLSVALVLACSTAARAESPADPLRLVPDQADLMVRVDKPRQLLDSYTHLDLLKQLTKFDAFQEYLDSTNYRRFLQLVGYFEKQLGAKWPEIVERVAGGGVVVAIKIGPNPAPALLVVQGKDEALAGKFLSVALDVIEQELARQDAKQKPVKESYRNLDTWKIGKDLQVARAGAAILLSNNETALHKALDLHLDNGKDSLANVASVGEAKKLLPANPLAWLWLNMDTVHKAPQAKDVFMLPRNDAIVTVALGGLLDIAGRSPFFCAALCQDDRGLLLTARLPRGRDGSAEALTTHIPPADTVGSLPLLEPKGVIYSSSYYMDMGKFWDNRAKLFNAQQVKAFEEADKNTGRLPISVQVSKILTQAGPHQRLVVAHQPKSGYQTQPQQRLPAFAFVLDMREPEKFGKMMEGILRGAALLGGTQFKLKLVEEKHGDLTLVGYRFPDDVKQIPNENTLVYNFSPCFVAVGDQFLAASTIELGHEMIDLLQKEAKNPPKRNSAASVSKVYASGGADLLQAIEEQLFAQTILDRALPPAEAKQQVKELIDFVRRLGVLETEQVYGEHDWRQDFRLTLGK
jgi:hypothetical protein